MTNFILVLSLVLSGFNLSLLDLAWQGSGSSVESSPSGQPDWLQLVADYTGYDVADLELGDVTTIPLLMGEIITKVKAVDTRSGAILGATFSGTSVVDGNALQAQSAAQWRAEHGAMTPQLVTKLAAAEPGDTFMVSAWLKATIEPLTKPDHNPAGQEPPGTTAGPAAAQPGASAKASSDPEVATKIPATPLSEAEFQAAGAALSKPPAASGPPPTPSSELPKPPAGAAAGAEKRDQELQQQQRAQAQAFQLENEATLRRQVAEVRSRFLAYATAQGLQVLYASELAPVVHLANVTREQLLALARHPDVDALYDASVPGGAALDVARPTQNMLPVADWGTYTGTNVAVAVVEGERAANNNPYLTIVETRDPSRTPRWHPTMVSGIVASAHGTQRGLARDADVYSANGDDYTTIAALEAAMDWGSSRASILNNSYWADNCGATSILGAIDRHMDYLVRYNYDLATVASGNFRLGGCGPTGSNYVNSPSKGYNALTVGNFDDMDTVGWAGDAMNPDSQYNVDGRYKPELAASGTDITSLTQASPWIGTGSGTSFSSPMVAALAADMAQADPGLTGYPEAASALLMATALHNIEGDARLSRADGMGSIDGSAALVSVERDHWGSQSVDSTTVFPLDFYQFAHQGERVRYVIRWLSNPNASYTSDPLPADLDLTAFRANGAYIQGSISSVDSFEIVEFVAPASETYRFQVSLFGGWNGGNTWLGRGWWRGVYRISPDIGYTDPIATPMGTHLTVVPTDWSPTNYWRVMNIRSLSSDHDLYLYNKSFFEDPDGLAIQRSSTYGSGVDFITVDGNHWPASTPERYVVQHWSGSGGYDASWSNLGLVVSGDGYYGPYTAYFSEVAKVFDLYMDRYQYKRIEIVPTGSNANDLAAELFGSTAGSASSWSQARGDGVASGNASAVPGFIETLAYYHDSDVADYLGLVVHGNLRELANYYVRVACTLNQDVHGDGRVDVRDVQYVASYWQAASPPDRADRDNDGDVDVYDIALVAGEWNRQC